MKISMLVAIMALSFLFNYAYPTLPVIVWYLINVNLFTCILFTVDKIHAKLDKTRVPEIALHYFSIVGGIFGALLMMLIFSHKLSKGKFLFIQLFILAFWAGLGTYVYFSFEQIITFIQGFFN